MSIPWFPSNGSGGEFLYNALCVRCKKEPTCLILEKAFCECEPNKEWTAEDCSGRGLKCSAFEKQECNCGCNGMDYQHSVPSEHEPRIQVPGQTDIRDIL